MAKGITAQEMDSATASGLVPHLGTTTNSGNSYSVTSNTPISTNQKFTLKFNVASSTAPTLKINNDTALPIKNANGNNAKLYASVYTLFRDGSAFILQGEGGEYGTAKTEHVLSPQTIGTEDGVKQGTMPNKGAVTITPLTTDQPIPLGYHNGSGRVIGDPDLKSENIREGINMFNVQGTLKPTTSAHATIKIGQTSVPVDSGTTFNKDVITIPAGTSIAQFEATDGYRSFLRIKENSATWQTAQLLFKDSAGKSVTLNTMLGDILTVTYVIRILINTKIRKVYIGVERAGMGATMDLIDLPTDFNVDDNMYISVRFQNPSQNNRQNMEYSFDGTLTLG